ncbi:Alpha/Beta hydrolase protein [Cokeromyces recurvatus]|uniref:Alpha/Beta hydrolase protein n=1 Tax=Cokeromyces recurvatus TaxID=90255 RepID=UPI0022204DBF|nr:Alpha/Beta hydrolase protein [Cokeromyces recurvatus]KAI7898646.1 Alpha/Beta hydrolase protein [Cokeromyces recurvatus]
MVEIKPYGAWPSPITAESLSAGATATDTCVDNGFIYWCQSVAHEKGRGQIFKQSIHDSQLPPEALLPAGYSCMTRVHEYGLGAFKVSNGLVVFSNNDDSRLYTIFNNEIKPLTQPNTLYRYADLTIDKENRFLVCVREEHFLNEEPKDVVNVLVSIDLNSGHETIIAQGEDFYAFPRLSAQNELAFVCWKHPNMPWDFTRLYYANTLYENEQLVLKDMICVAGDEIEESISQPEFGIDGTLYFASDRSGFWNLYSFNGKEVNLLLERPLEQEFVGPLWRFNPSDYTPLKSNAHQLIVVDKDSLAILDTQERTLSRLDCKYDHFSDLRIYLDDNQHEYVLGNMSSTTEPCSLVSYDIKEQVILHVHQRTETERLEAEYISIGKEIEFPTTDGRTAYCYFYAPKNPNYQDRPGALPPLRLLSHGGPTSSTNNSYKRSIQYWTTRGFAIADVNYGGSTGYGRAYRNRLRLNWGVVDVDDCCNAALYLAKEGLVDGNKLAIEGGSAGGFTTLASLAFRPRVFQAGCCRYGISDITLLAKETHKFESRYPDRLIGEYPREKEIYIDRSPLFKANQIECPIIFFQGSQDKVVPPSQAEVMVNALKQNHVPVAYVLYEGEAHGFRRAENIKRTIELEQWFYGQIFGFPVEDVEGVKIYNFPQNK